MYYYKEELINIIKPDKPNPAAAKVLQEILGGHYGEMRTMMQYFFQSSNFRGKEKQFRDLLRGVFLEEIAHVELVQHTINALLDESGAEGPEIRQQIRRRLTKQLNTPIRTILLSERKVLFL